MREQKATGVWWAWVHRYVTARVEPGISGRNNLETLAVCELLVRSARDHRTAERAELA